MKITAITICLILSLALYWQFNRRPTEHPPEIVVQMDFYKQAAKDKPAD